MGFGSSNDENFAMSREPRPSLTSELASHPWQAFQILNNNFPVNRSLADRVFAARHSFQIRYRILVNV